MSNITDLDQAFMGAMAKAAEWEAKFQEKWYGPVILQEQTMAFLTMPPAERELIKDADPALYAKLVANVDQLHRRVMRPKGASYVP